MRLLIACVMMTAMAAPAYAQAPDSTPLQRLAAADQRLLDIGWRLARGSAGLCPDTRPAIGLTLVDARSFGDPAAVREERGLAHDVAVQAVAAGSPAALAGLVYNQPVDHAAGLDVVALPVEAESDWRRQSRLHQAIDDALQHYEAVGVGRPGEAPRRVDGVPACYARFEVLSGSDRALADGVRVMLGDRWLADEQADDEVAFMVAHELAHNILKHRLRRDLPRRLRPSAKDVEREADRLAPWLMANAGYDPQGAVAFLQRHGPKQDGPLYLSFSHDGWKSRREAVQTEILAMTTQSRVDGRYDWTHPFSAELAAARAAIEAQPNR